ncbi:MAG: c-type cytochrome [Mariprofundus sp.]|nr:c-type cytochrome [Mariprofundus sp.]
MKIILKMAAMAFMAAFLIGTFTATEAMAGAEAKCKACHNFTAKKKVGPGLKGVFGREAGTADFKKYSASMKKGGWVWDEKNLRTFLTNTKKGIKTLTGDKKAKTKMKIKVKGDRLDEVIAFLKELK